MSEKNTERVERQKKSPINVIIGNPPYNVGQHNENDNNKNRSYRRRSKVDPLGVDDRISATYARDSKATNKNALSDMFVKFFRWASDRLQNRDGIVCFVSNNAFVENIAYDGMRKHLLTDFDTIYHLDLRGNVRQNPRLSGTAYNVFGIQVGVGITLAIRHRQKAEKRLLFHRLDLDLRREAKLARLTDLQSVKAVEWQSLVPDARNTWLVPEGADEFATFLPVGDKITKEANFDAARTIFWQFSVGLKTNRDSSVYDFSRDRLASKVESFIDAYNTEVLRFRKHAGGKRKSPEFQNLVDQFADRTKDQIQWSEGLKTSLTRGTAQNYESDNLRRALYRPFVAKTLYFDRTIIERVYQFPSIFPTPEAEQENRIITISDIGYRAPNVCALVSNCIVDLHLCASSDAHQCFPFYTYDEDGSNRRENITDWALETFQSHYSASKQASKQASNTIAKWDIFHYVYGILHHPAYRTKYADNLKRELPRIPFAPDFWAFAHAGADLARLHLDYEQLDPWPLDWIETPGAPLSDRVEKMRLSKDRSQLVVNDYLTLGNIPPQTFDYRLGNRSALDWVIDQYQLSTDPRTGITSDPNRPDDPEYITRLVGQVVRVSIETVRLVATLPASFGG
jgi:predicted helicase